jgi:hypothetical protein
MERKACATQSIMSQFLAIASNNEHFPPDNTLVWCEKSKIAVE